MFGHARKNKPFQILEKREMSFKSRWTAAWCRSTWPSKSDVTACIRKIFPCLSECQEKSKVSTPALQASTASACELFRSMASWGHDRGLGALRLSKRAHPVRIEPAQTSRRSCCKPRMPIYETWMQLPRGRAFRRPRFPAFLIT